MLDDTVKDSIVNVIRQLPMDKSKYRAEGNSRWTVVLRMRLVDRSNPCHRYYGTGMFDERNSVQLCQTKRIVE